MTTVDSKTKKKEPVLLNIALNIALPTVIMMKLSKEEYLGPVYSLVAALALPVAYGIYDFAVRKNVNFVSILGFVSVLLTGVFGLFELSPMWIAVKEASVPLIIGIFVLLSINTKYPLVEKLLLNDSLMKLDLIYKALEVNDKEAEFKEVLKRASYLVAFSFLVSSVLNFVLARIVLVSPPGTPEYTAEIGRMTGLSFVVIALPSSAILMVALYYLFKQLNKLTGLKFEEFMNK